MNRVFYPLRCRITGESSVTRVDVYDDIGSGGLFGGGLSARDFAAELSGITGSLEVHLNSGGGDVFDGLAIASAVRGHPGPVTVVVDGLAASIASVIMQAGQKRVMTPGSMVMIHDAFGQCAGNAAEMAKMAETLDQVSGNLAGVYAERAGGTPESWRDAMRQETWYTADEAVAAGLADTVAATGSAYLPPGLDLAALGEVPGRIAARLAQMPVTGQKNTATKVVALLSRDYPPEWVAWAFHCAWMGPMAVKVSAIDMTGYKPGKFGRTDAEIDHFRQQIQKKGHVKKPAVLVKTPDSQLLTIADGHGRAAASADENVPLWAYVGVTAADHGDWEKMHDHQDIAGDPAAALARRFAAVMAGGDQPPCKTCGGTGRLKHPSTGKPGRVCPGCKGSGVAPAAGEPDDGDQDEGTQDALTAGDVRAILRQELSAAQGQPGTHGDHERVDPDGDGDCDACAAGDTDHDYWSADGKQIKSLPGKPLPAGGDGKKAPFPGAAPPFKKKKSKAGLREKQVRAIIREELAALRAADGDVDNSPWDAGKAWHNGAASDDPAKFYAGICAGKKSGDPSTQAAWALPYKYTPSSPPNAAAVRNALSRLPQTQGLTNEAEAKATLQAAMKQISPDYNPDDYAAAEISAELVEEIRSALKGAIE